MIKAFCNAIFAWSKKWGMSDKKSPLFCWRVISPWLQFCQFYSLKQTARATKLRRHLNRRLEVRQCSDIGHAQFHRLFFVYTKNFKFRNFKENIFCPKVHHEWNEFLTFLELSSEAPVSFENYVNCGFFSRAESNKNLPRIKYMTSSHLKKSGLQTLEIFLESGRILV